LEQTQNFPRAARQKWWGLGLEPEYVLLATILHCSTESPEGITPNLCPLGAQSLGMRGMEMGGWSSLHRASRVTCNGSVLTALCVLLVSLLGGGEKQGSYLGTGPSQSLRAIETEWQSWDLKAERGLAL
jgi:hypothetical protein